MTLRPPRVEDAPAVAALFGATGPELVSQSLFERAWTAPGHDAERDVRVAERDGRVVGYVEVEDAGGRHAKFRLWMRGEPGAELLPFAERRVLETAATGSRILAEAWSEDAQTKETLERAGFGLVRHSLRMGIELEGRVNEPVWPDAIRMRTFRRGDERAVYEAHQETFEDLWDHVRRPYDEWAHWFLSPELHDPDLWFLAFDGEQLAGIALCRADPERPGVGWVDILGVRRAWRGRGLGLALLRHAFREFGRRGFERVVLGVDGNSPTGAQKLYERAGMRVLHRFDTYEKVVS